MGMESRHRRLDARLHIAVFRVLTHYLTFDRVQGGGVLASRSSRSRSRRNAFHGSDQGSDVTSVRFLDPRNLFLVGVQGGSGLNGK